MIAIVDYKAGNSHSVLHAARRLGLDAALTSRAQEVKDASHIILPGVGNAKATMESLKETGFIDALETAVLRRGAYYLGICVGLQILFEHSDEEDTDCLGWLKGRVVKFSERELRIPQMGWNEVRFVKDAAVESRDGFFYFVNSYHALPEDTSDIWGMADYGGNFTAAVNRDNIYAAQFHVEKSGEAGLAVLKSFCNTK